MSTDAIITLVVAALIVAAAALGLFAGHLPSESNGGHPRCALDGGVQVIVEKTSTVEPVVTSVTASLAPVRSFAESI